MRQHVPIRVRHKGLSLLEVILALAILGGALAVIGELMRIGLRAAELSRNETYAQLLCESKIAELASGIALPEPVVDEVLDPEGNWVHSVTVERSDDQTLMAVQVTVRPANRIDETQSFTLVRWMADPQIEFADLEMQSEQEMAEDERIEASKEASAQSTDAAANALNGLGANSAGNTAQGTNAPGGGGLLPGNVRGFGNGGGRNQGPPGDGQGRGGPGNRPPRGEGGEGRNGGPGDGGGNRNGPPGGRQNGPPNGQPPSGFGNGRGSPNFQPGNFQPGGPSNAQIPQPGQGGFGGGRGR
jgi:type II secretion system protein I